MCRPGIVGWEKAESLVAGVCDCFFLRGGSGSCARVHSCMRTVGGIWQFSSFTSEIMQARRSSGVKYHRPHRRVLFRLGTMETLARLNSPALKRQSCSRADNNGLTFQIILSARRSFTDLLQISKTCLKPAVASFGFEVAG